MSDRVLASLGALAGTQILPVGSDEPVVSLTWVDRIAALQAGEVGPAVTVHYWGRSEVASGTVYPMEIGADGIINHPEGVNYNQGALLENSDGGSSLGLRGDFPDPPHIEIATVVQATWELNILLQNDNAQNTGGRVVMQINGGANEAGGAECKLFADGLGSLKFRFESCAVAGSRVIKDGSTPGQVPIGQTSLLSFVRTATDLLCFINNEERSMNLVLGTLPSSSWPAPAAGTTYIGAFFSTSGDSNGINGLLGEVLITNILTTEQRAYLAAHPRKNVVIALDDDAGTVNENTTAINIGLTDRVHPETGDVAITTPPSVGLAEIGPNSIIYTPPTSVAVNTPVSIGYTYKVGEITTAPAEVNLTVNNVVIPEPPPSADLPEEEALPAPAGTAPTVRDATPATIDSIFASVTAGNHIRLLNGSYGNRVFNRTFPANNKVVIRAQNSLLATFGTITLGSGIILSGVSQNGGNTYGITINAGTAGVRITRSKISMGNRCFRLSVGAKNFMVDHCEITQMSKGTFELDGGKDQTGIIVARNWIHAMRGNPEGRETHYFGWNGANTNREKRLAPMVRFNFIADSPPADTAPDPIAPGVDNYGEHIHNKVSDSVYAFNLFNPGADTLLSLRFGLRIRFLCNWAPNSELRAWDSRAWIYGNRIRQLQCPMGRSHYYDDFKNLASGAHNSVGGFHAHKQSRISGNISLISLGTEYSGNNFCTGGFPDPITEGGTLPDPLAAGQVKQFRTFGGVNYAADQAFPNDDAGIKIRSHSGLITRNTTPCVNLPGGKVQNLDPSNAGGLSTIATLPPGSWLVALFTEHPWIQAYCPDPTVQNGGPDNSHPSSVAQALTRGDVAINVAQGLPNVGVNRPGNAGRFVP